MFGRLGGDWITYIHIFQRDISEMKGNREV